MLCDMCHEREAQAWYLMEGNAEVELCDECAEELKASDEVDLEDIEVE